MAYRNGMNGNSSGAGVRFAMIESTADTGNMPTNAANQYNVGINAQGGLIEYLCLRYDLTFADNPASATTIIQLIDSIRIVIRKSSAYKKCSLLIKTLSKSISTVQS